MKEFIKHNAGVLLLGAVVYSAASWVSDGAVSLYFSALSVACSALSIGGTLLRHKDRLKTLEGDRRRTQAAPARVQT